MTPTLWLLAAAITLAVQWLLHARFGDGSRFDWIDGALCVVAWPVMMVWTVGHFVQGCVGGR